jgi:hypothetical protein
VFLPFGDEQVDYVGRLPNGRFATGNPGRRRGSRNRTTHRVVMTILEDFENHRQPLLEALRTSWPVLYFNILTRLLPRLMDADTTESIEDWSEKEAAQFVHRARQILSSAPSPREALIELERLFAGADPGADNFCEFDNYDFDREGRIVPP